MRDRGEFVSRGNRFRPISRIFDYPLPRWPWWEFAAGRMYVTGPVSDVGRSEPQPAGCRVIPNKNDDCFSVGEIDGAPIARIED